VLHTSEEGSYEQMMSRVVSHEEATDLVFAIIIPIVSYAEKVIRLRFLSMSNLVSFKILNSPKYSGAVKE